MTEKSPHQSIDNPGESVLFFLGQLSKDMQHLNEKVNGDLRDHEIRIRSVEKTVWRMSAVGGLIGGIAVVIGQALLKVML